MRRYIVKKILIAAVTFLGITAFVFILSNMAPGSPADVIASQSSGDMSAEQYEALRHSLGLDRPAIVRYLVWLSDFFRGDMGISTRTSQPVSYMISERIGGSLLLMFTSLIVALMISIPLGVASACRPHSAVDRASTLLAFLGSSTPNFFFSLVLIYIFAVKLGILPAQGSYDTGMEGSVLSLIRHMILPTVVLAFQMTGTLIKQTKGAVEEVLHEEYVRTAMAKGLSVRRVVIKHGLRNALSPIVTAIGGMVPFLVGGAVITEQIFGWAGIGSLMMLSINSRDYNAIMGITVVIALAVIITNIAIDFLYTLIDPRVRMA